MRKEIDKTNETGFGAVRTLLRCIAGAALGLVLAVQTGCASLDGLTARLDRPEVQELFDKAVTRIREEMAKTNAAERIEDAVAEIGNQSQPDDSASGVDAVPFRSLVWSYGGFRGSGAALDTTARITGLKVSGGTLSYAWAGGGCESLGAGNANDYGSALACLFVKDNAGKWVGGKFDWISTSRTSRSLANVFGGYHGWSLGNVPNPCETAFVIVGLNGRRTNVVKSTWRR
jgi:hypothetical protein